MEGNRFLAGHRNPRRCQRTVERSPDQLRPCAHTSFVEQLLQSRFYGGFRHTDLAADLLVRETVKQGLEHCLLPFGEAAQALILVLRVAIGYELNHSLIHRSFPTRDEPNRLHQATRRITLQKNAGCAELQCGG